MPYSFVWLYLIKCVFTCSIFVDSNTKRFLSVLVVLESILFFKNWKFQKQCCPILATQLRVSQVACHNCELAGQFWRLVHKWNVQSRGVHRDFRSSARDSLTSETSSREKHLANFSKFLVWSVLASDVGDFLATYLSRKKRVFCTITTVFKIFLSFPSNFMWLFTFSFDWNYPKHSVPLSTNSIFASFLLKIIKERYGSSLTHFIFYVLSIIFLLFELSLFFF